MPDSQRICAYCLLPIRLNSNIKVPRYFDIVTRSEYCQAEGNDHIHAPMAKAPHEASDIVDVPKAYQDLISEGKSDLEARAIIASRGEDRYRAATEEELATASRDELFRRGFSARQVDEIVAHRTMKAATDILEVTGQPIVNLEAPDLDPVTQEYAEKSSGKEHDPVNHPSHYTAYPGIEIIQLTRRMNFNRGNAVKYIARAGLKDPSKEVEDLEKAIFYLQDEVKLIKGEYD